MNALLREVFEERAAAEPAGVRHGARPADVHRRIVRVRRNRTVAAGVAAVAVTVAVVSTIASTGDHRRVAPERFGAGRATSAAESTGGFPEYFHGARVVATASASLPDTVATFTFVPRTLDLKVFTRCDLPEGSNRAYLRINGHAMGGTCGGIVRASAAEEIWAELGVVVGKPTTVELALMREPSTGAGSTDDPPAGHGTLVVAAGEQVPFEDYPLPSRPTTLPPLATEQGEVTTVRNVPGEPLTQQSVQVDWTQKLLFHAQMQTPGSIRVLVDDREVTECTKWDYHKTATKPSQIEIDSGCYEELVLGDADNPGGPGDVVTVTVVPEHVTGDWAVRVDR